MNLLRIIFDYRKKEDIAFDEEDLIELNDDSESDDEMHVAMKHE